MGQFSLGALHAAGKGLPEDYVTAYKWLNLSAAQGFGDSIGVKEEIAQKMTKEQISEAQKLSGENLRVNLQKTL